MDSGDSMDHGHRGPHVPRPDQLRIPRKPRSRSPDAAATADRPCGHWRSPVPPGVFELTWKTGSDVNPTVLGRSTARPGSGPSDRPSCPAG